MLIRDTIYDCFFVIELLKPLEIAWLTFCDEILKSALPRVVVLSINSAELRFYCRVTVDHSPVKLTTRAI